MNGNFERSGIFPFGLRPLGGWSNEPTGEYVITNVNHPGKAVRIGPQGDAEYVDEPEATVFKDVVTATQAAARL